MFSNHIELNLAFDGAHTGALLDPIFEELLITFFSSNLKGPSQKLK